MDPVVTARVPEGVRDRGVEVLKSIGATTSELVNAAFDYVIQAGELPRYGLQAPTGTRTLSKRQARELSEFMDLVKVDVPDTWNNASFEELYEEAIEQRYANLR